MSENLEELSAALNNASGAEQRKLFLEYCRKLIELRDAGELSEEQAGSKIISAMRPPDVWEDPAFDGISDAASDLDISRTSSFRQGIGHWDPNVADKIKEKEWRKLLVAVERAEKEMD